MGSTGRTILNNLQRVLTLSLIGTVVGSLIYLGLTERYEAAQRAVVINFVFMSLIIGAGAACLAFVFPRMRRFPRAFQLPLQITALVMAGSVATLPAYAISEWLFQRTYLHGAARTNIILFNGIALAFLGLLYTTYTSMREQIERDYQELSRHREREQRLAELASEAKLKALRAQINPHFLFNALNTISALIVSNPEAAERTIEKLARIFRYTLETADQATVQLRNELDFIQDYLEIERARFGERLTVLSVVDPDMHAVSVPSMILQPLVENAVKHAVNRRVEGAKVEICAQPAGDCLEICVRDNGHGISDPDPERLFAKGVGLRNVHERLVNSFGPQAGLVIESQPQQGTAVRFKVPLSREGSGLRSRVAP
jgi:signal transduction histidine kinase